jgi:hypothetical protein
LLVEHIQDNNEKKEDKNKKKDNKSKEKDSDGSNLSSQQGEFKLPLIQAPRLTLACKSKIIIIIIIKCHSFVTLILVHW